MSHGSLLQCTRMSRLSRFSITAQFLALAWLASPVAPRAFAAPAPEVGDPVPLSRGETLLLDGKNFAQASKGQVFTLVKRDPGTVHVAFTKEDGSIVALAVPADAVESVPPAP